MDFSLSEEQALIRQTARDFADSELRPNARAWDEERGFPSAAVKKLGELGFLGMMVPSQWGGAELDSVSYALAIEEISRGCASTGVIMSVNNSLVCHPLQEFANEEQKGRLLKPLAEGTWLGAYCLTEPQAGSDAGATKTIAVRAGDDWVLNGTKIFVTNGHYADAFVVYASTDPAQKTRGITAFVVEKTRPGVKLGTREKTLGIRASATSEIVFEDVRVPDANRLGDVNRGFKIAMMTLNGGRIGIAAQAVGIAQAALERAIEYAKTRKQFDQPIANFQAIRWKLAEMATKVEAARLLVLTAAHAKDQGADYAAEASRAKLFASRAAVEVSDEAIQIHGGYGYVGEYEVERHYRDAKVTELYEGTSEIQKLVIARGLLQRA